jgi:putative endonuclease
MFYIYILYSEIAGKFYIGHTDDINRRLAEHNNPRINSKFTAKYISWSLALSFPVSENRGEAMKVEKFIKKQKSRSFISRLIENKTNLLFFKKLTSDIIGEVRAVPQLRD